MKTWGFDWWESVAQDLRFGVRMLLRRPVFSLVVISVLASGIGLNAAMFSIVEAVILRPLPYRDAKQLTIVWQSSPEHRATGEWFDTYRDFQEWRKRSRRRGDFVTRRIHGGNGLPLSRARPVSRETMRA